MSIILKHHSLFLNQNFNGYQGQSIENADIIIFGQDANFREDFDSLLEPTKIAFKKYFNDFELFLKEYSHLEIHTPLLLSEYKKNGSAGLPYHKNYLKICKHAVANSDNYHLTHEIFSKTCFLEILDFPTMPNPIGKPEVKDYKELLKNDNINTHLYNSLSKIVFSNKKIKVFVTPTISDIIFPILHKITQNIRLKDWLQDTATKWEKHEYNDFVTFYKICHLSGSPKCNYTDAAIEKVANFIIE